MNTMQIRCFLAAAGCLNFTQAAAELFISQPALSHNISLLEQEWGVELFARSNKRKDTYLTPAGAAMYEGMKELWEQYENILQKARKIHEGKAGTLKIGLFGSNRMDERILTIFDRFQEAFPEVELSLLRGSNSELMKGVSNNTLDIAFALKIDVEDKKGLAYREVFSLETVLLLTEKHPLSKREDLSLSDFRDDTFINISSKESPAINSLLKIECGKAGFAPKFIEAPDIYSQILYMEAGKGVAICSVNNIAAYNSRIKTKFLRDLKPLETVMVWNRTNNNPCISSFVSVYESIK